MLQHAGLAAQPYDKLVANVKGEVLKGIDKIHEELQRLGIEASRLDQARSILSGKLQTLLGDAKQRPRGITPTVSR